MIWEVVLIVLSLRLSHWFIIVGGPIGLVAYGAMAVWARWQDKSDPVYPLDRPPGSRVIVLANPLPSTKLTDADSLKRAA